MSVSFPEVAGSGPFAHSLPYTRTHFLCRSGLAVRGEGTSFSQGCPRQAPQPGEVGNPASERAGAGAMLGAKASPADVALSPAVDHKIWLKFSLRPLLIIFWDR